MVSTSRQDVTPKKATTKQHAKHANHHIYHPSNITRSLVFADPLNTAPSATQVDAWLRHHGKKRRQRKQQRNNMQNSIETQHWRHGNHHIYHPSDITRSLVFADSFHHNPFIFSKSPNAALSSAFCETPRLFHGKIKLRFLSKANKAQ